MASGKRYLACQLGSSLHNGLRTALRTRHENPAPPPPPPPPPIRTEDIPPRSQTLLKAGRAKVSSSLFLPTPFLIIPLVLFRSERGFQIMLVNELGNLNKVRSSFYTFTCSFYTFKVST